MSTTWELPKTEGAATFKDMEAIFKTMREKNATPAPIDFSETYRGISEGRDELFVKALIDDGLDMSTVAEDPSIVARDYRMIAMHRPLL